MKKLIFLLGVNMCRATVRHVSSFLTDFQFKIVMRHTFIEIDQGITLMFAWESESHDKMSFSGTMISVF